MPLKRFQLERFTFVSEFSRGERRGEEEANVEGKGGWKGEFCPWDSIEEVVDQVLNIITSQIKHREITAEIMNPLVSLIS